MRDGNLSETGVAVKMWLPKAQSNRPFPNFPEGKREEKEIGGFGGTGSPHAYLQNFSPHAVSPARERLRSRFGCCTVDSVHGRMLLSTMCDLSLSLEQN